MTVLCLKSDYGRTGGAEHLLAALLGHLDRRRLGLGLGLVSGDPGYRLPYLDPVLDLPVQHLAWRGLAWLPATVLHLARVLRGTGCRLLYSHDMRANLLAWLVRRLVPIRWVAHVHGWLGDTAILRTRCYEAVDRWIVGNAGHVVVGSQALAREITGRHPALPVSCIANAIDPASYTVPGAGEVLAIRRRLFGHRPGPVVGCVGRLHPGKGQRLLVRAVAALKREFPGLCCLLVGEGPDREALQGLGRDLGLGSALVLTGYVSQVAPYLAAMDVAAFCSYAESLPLALLEAMVLERPVVASRVGDVGRVLERLDPALLFTAGDTDGLIRRLAALLADPRRRCQLGRQARQVVEDHYSVAAAARRVEGILVDELGGDHGR